MQYLIVTPNNIVAAVTAIQYWDHKKYNPAIWISIIILMILFINLLGVKVFGEVEVRPLFSYIADPYSRPSFACIVPRSVLDVCH